MKKIARLVMMIISLIIIVSIGRYATHSFEFLTNQFWFVSGALLLILLALVDQPNFSKDANVFINGSTALISLFVVPIGDRDNFWWIFLFWTLYLIISSTILMLIRTDPLHLESRKIQFFSRLNREIGRPEAVFSVFLLWGAFLQFSYPKDQIIINLIFVFWAMFMIVNIPAISILIQSLFEKVEDEEEVAGVLAAMHTPNIADIKFSPELTDTQIGKKAVFYAGGKNIASGYVFDEKFIKGNRLGKVSISNFTPEWRLVSSDATITVKLANDEDKSLGIVDKGTTIDKLVFRARPDADLISGQIVKVPSTKGDLYYQIISARVEEESLEEGNSSLNVCVEAGQLGFWLENSATFEPISWVPTAGSTIYTTRGMGSNNINIHERAIVGAIPQSDFPIHLHISDSITHNTAIIGVTGSGKSYLAFDLIESYLAAGIKVLILDPTRQHWQYLQHRNPTALPSHNDVAAWYSGTSLLGVHQFANATSLPASTANFVESCSTALQTGVQLQAGVDIPAKLVIIYEEAHSLIPEWNQVAVDSDKSQVNRTSRVVLQGRKFGLGSIVITQRTANVTKTILNQCNTIFALRSFDQTGLDFLENYMGSEYSKSICTLSKYHAVLIGKASSSSRPVIMQIKDLASRWTTAANLTGNTQQ